MKLLDVGQRATGIIAIGQEATGFIAIGQVATGVIAIGQMARGCFTVGQLAFGLVGWGQLGVGLLHAMGMVGLGGRRGPGLVLPLVPSVGKRRVAPTLSTFEAVNAGHPGWLPVEVVQAQQGLCLGQSGHWLPIKLDRRVLSGAELVAREGARAVWAFVRRIGPVLVCDRLAYEPLRPYQRKPFWPLSAVQFVGLLALGSVWWLAAGNDLTKALGVFDDSDRRGSQWSSQKPAPVSAEEPAPPSEPAKRNKLPTRR